MGRKLAKRKSMRNTALITPLVSMIDSVSVDQPSPALCTVVQAYPTRKHDRAIVARSGYAAWPVAEPLYQKLCNLLGEFCIDILMKNKMFTNVGYLSKHILKD